jgi:L-ascorbate metabolism protein UlaG (beta-lactamase superfamily)
VGDVFTVGPEAAKRVVESLSPKVAVPMHYRVPGMRLSIQPVQNFLRLFDQSAVVKVGNEVDFAQEDLPGSRTEIWVFSP